MLDLEDPETVYQLKAKPYQLLRSEPICLTAARAGIKVYTANFLKCDSPRKSFYRSSGGISPEELELSWNLLRSNVLEAVDRLGGECGLAMVYEEVIDTIGHIAGVDSESIREGLIRIDGIVMELLRKLKDENLDDKVSNFQNRLPVGFPVSNFIF